MDAPLRSSRQPSNDYYGHGGGGHGGGGGRYRNSNRRGRRGGGGGNRNRFQPYGRPGGGSGGNRRRNQNANRYTHEDPRLKMVLDVQSFVSRAGEFKGSDMPPAEPSQTNPELRPVMATTAQNIKDLTLAICGGDTIDDMFRYYPPAPKSDADARANGDADGDADANMGDDQRNPVDPEREAGRIVHTLVACAAGLPLQTPCYASLTLALQEQTRGATLYDGIPISGIAPRCVSHAMRYIAQDIDFLLCFPAAMNTSLPSTGAPERAAAVCRLKLTLRYLAILGKMGVVSKYAPDMDLEDVPAYGADQSMSLLGLLGLIAKAASAAAEQHDDMNGACILAIIALHTLPYVIDGPPRHLLKERVLRPIESFLGSGSYQSTFLPGSGSTPLLLKEPEDQSDDEEEEEEDDDDDDDEDGGSGQMCDTLQDLVSSTRNILSSSSAIPSRFSLFTDAPWKGLPKETGIVPMEGDAATPAEFHHITYDEDPLYLNFSLHESKALKNLLDTEADDYEPSCDSLEGIVFGRLPIFGSPDPDGEDEDMEQDLTANPNLKAYVRGFNTIDRFIVLDSLRDILISHACSYTPSGAARGDAKHIALELLSIHNVLLPPDDGSTPPQEHTGAEYAILEVLLGLLAQCTTTGSIRHLMLSRVLLELVRLKPVEVSSALAVGMTNLFQDYLPALVPTARDNLARWFSFHLINTDYQWPPAFWQLWAPKPNDEKITTRGTFVKRTVELLSANTEQPQVYLQEDLPEVLHPFIVPDSTPEEEHKAENDDAEQDNEQSGDADIATEET